MALLLLNGAQGAKKPTGALAVLCLKASYSTGGDAPRVLPTTKLSSLKRGTGGRSSFNGMVVSIFGSTGLVGRSVANKFGKIGSQLVCCYRGDFYDAARLKLTGDLGQVLYHFYHLKDEKSVREAVKHSNVVVNLAGRDWETKNFTFNDVHVEGARRIARLCREAGVERLIHLSALNASPEPTPIIWKGGSKFLKSKHYGELAVQEEFPNATIIRPADIYGREDRFAHYYSHIWRRQLHGMPLWNKGEKTIKQPVFVGDVAQAIVNAARDPDSAGKIYQAVGPRRYLLSEIVDWFHREMRKDGEWGYYRYDMRYDPSFFFKVWLTKKITPSHYIGDLHQERIEREHVTDEVDNSIPTLEDLGVNLTYMEDQIPWEMRPYRAYQYYNESLGDFATPAKPKFIDPRADF